MKKVLYWDFDGTLSRPNKAFSTALSDSLREQGDRPEAEVLQRFLDTFYSWKTPERDYVGQTGAGWWEIHFEKLRTFCKHRQLPEEAVRRICTGFREKLTDVSNYQLYEDTVSTLETCRSLGFENYLITNNYPEITDNLQKLGISGYFTDFIVSSHIGFEKPRNEFFAYAKSLSGDPGIGYVIGDNPIADIQGGRNAGFKTIAVHECKLSTADHYCETLREITEIIKRRTA